MMSTPLRPVLSHDAETGLPPEEFRHSMARFTTGVCVVSALDAEGGPQGMTLNSLTSVSLEPPTLLVCLARGGRTTKAVVDAERFAISVLSARQEPIARSFARHGEEHFSGLPLAFGCHDVPVVPAALVHLECATAAL